VCGRSVVDDVTLLILAAATVVTATIRFSPAIADDNATDELRSVRCVRCCGPGPRHRSASQSIAAAAYNGSPSMDVVR